MEKSLSEKEAFRTRAQTYEKEVKKLKVDLTKEREDVRKEVELANSRAKVAEEKLAALAKESENNLEEWANRAMFWADKIHLAYELTYAEQKVARREVDMSSARLAAKWDALSLEERRQAMIKDFMDGYKEDKVDEEPNPTSSSQQAPEAAQGDGSSKPMVNLE
ncbi:hypothetical protein M5689_008421 [Euphorbia peplus]|nr:hypothetical protein M5689_008421 [Euphorbia peplus]